MRKTVLIFVVLMMVLGGVTLAQQKKAASGTGARPASTVEVDAKTQKILDKINAAGPYEVPGLEVRKDDNYARTPEDIEPFSRMKPFQEFFLEQMQYTGPGRAIPEPQERQDGEDRLYRANLLHRFGGHRRQKPRRETGRAHAARLEAGH